MASWPEQDRLMRRLAVALILAGLGLAALAAAALAHTAPAGWEYDRECCSVHDCAPVPDAAVREVAGGYALRLAPGEHPMVEDVAVEAFIPHGDDRIRVSGDPRRHACIGHGGRVYCIYVPPGGV